MLSTVGTHLGPGRAYSHPFAGPSVVPAALLPPTNLNSLPQNLNSALVSMSATEFARPHPKPRYNNMRNGSVGSSSKFTEQNTPVNLAVTNTTMSQSILHSPKDERIELQTKSEVHSPNANNLFPPSRIPYGPNPGVVTNSFREMDYTMFGRTSSMYGAPNLFVPNSRHQLQHRPYLTAPQLDYPGYLPNFNPPNSLGVLVPSHLPNISSQSAAISSLTSSTHNGGGTGVSGGNGLINHSSLSPSSLSLSSKSSLSTSSSSSIVNENNHRHLSLPSSIGRNSDKLLDKDMKERSHSISVNSVTGGGGDVGKHVGFKVPSGKEGSLKHRILTRPYGEKDGRRRSPNSVDKVTLVRPTTNNTTTNFTKGQLVEINGELKRIEDLRTEDFIMASEKAHNLQVIDTTVVKIVPDANNVIVTLSYGNHKKKVEMDVNPQQPFYVYGQGWASCNPDASMQVYGLKCQKLQVGDVCISLYTQNTLATQHHYQNISTPIANVPPPPPPSSHSISNFSHHQQHHHHHQQQAQLPPPPPQHLQSSPQQQQQQQQQPYYPYYGGVRDHTDVTPVPQNLSRRTNTIPTTATGTTVTSRPIVAMHLDLPYEKLSPTCIPQNVHSPKNLNHSIHSPYSGSVTTTVPILDTLGSDGGGSRTNSSSSSSSYSGGGGSSNGGGGSGSTNSGDASSRPSSNHAASAVSMVVQRYINEEQFDQMNSRKRRWSAPDNICDDDQTLISDDTKLMQH